MTHLPDAVTRTSACGTVTVHIGRDGAARVRLAPTADHLGMRALAELVTRTSREAADAVHRRASDEGAFPASAVRERFPHLPGGVDAFPGGEDCTGSAVSADGGVAVDATVEYPIARVLLTPRAMDFGPVVLGDELTLTAARAAADLDEQRREGIRRLAMSLGSVGRRFALEWEDRDRDDQEVVHLRDQLDGLTRRRGAGR
ncbi:hypothetical protein [Glycomyces sp. NPDC048151]|uniref:hypothetical protein n=1 Tax=Glycomyces sp. NPDC048151 TaxID=3364002 RepID=UPI0037248E15